VLQYSWLASGSKRWYRAERGRGRQIARPESHGGQHELKATYRNRNRAIKNRILRTDQHEFVTFSPTEIVGLEGVGTVGEAYSFQVIGDLTITGISLEVSLDVTVTPVSETRLEGVAATAFPYSDFELAIPDAPAVDTVEDEVRLEFELVAEAVPQRQQLARQRLRQRLKALLFRSVTMTSQQEVPRRRARAEEPRSAPLCTLFLQKHTMGVTFR
jgi:hypothetical protein